MGAIFTDLHDVAQVLTEHISEQAGITDVQPGPPRDVTGTTDAGARITLLYTTPQPGHRNDPEERGPDGSLRPPPLSLSCFYLVTTSGADNDDPIAAHLALGRIMTLYHDEPSLQLPLSDLDPAFSELGEGRLGVVQVPMVLDQLDKIWTPLDAQLQPWALFEVAPVQLVSPREERGPAPLVRPGGIGLTVRAARRPTIQRVAPELVRPGGRVRVDAIVPGDVEAVTAGDVVVPAGDASLVVAPDGSSLLLALDDGGLEALAEGAHRLAVRAAGLISRRATLRVAHPDAPAVDAPELTHAPADDLVLAGANLGSAQEALLWPDAGLTAPADVRSAAVTDVSAASVTIAAAELAGVPPERGPWRLALHLGGQVYTPYVLLELEP